ncbi:extracellular solute-binding protein [Marinobacter sp.]|uniref:extracellular solute-binding protein n=1 Tax=Marinobacter sp. TaxID=50741 RepID=UPI0039B04913
MTSMPDFRTLTSAVAGAILSVSLVSAPAVMAQDETEPRHGIAMYGDPAYPADFEHFAYVNPEAPKGGTLRLAVVANGFDSFNPFVIRGVAAADVSTYVYDTLMVSSDDEPFSAYGLIAESIETPEDRSYVIFKLRDEARFQDGKPITAEDVAFSFKILTTEGHPLFRNYYAEVSKVTVIDPQRVRFDFGETDNRELPLILGQLPILPKHYWQDREFTESGLTPPVGSGPYRIGDFEAGRSVTYQRVEDYWARDLAVNKGRYNFDAIRYEYYTDDTVALEAFKAGNYDFRLESSAKNWATAYTGEQFHDGRATTEELEHDRPVGMQAFVFNTRRSQFKDPLVRRAIAYAFDFDWANRNLFYGQYRRTDSYFENSELASSGLPEGGELRVLEAFRDRLPAEVFTEPYTVPSTTGDTSLRDNLRTGLGLLRQAGYAIKDGIMVNTATGEPLTFEILLAQKNFERIVLPFAANLEKLGIKVNVRLIDTNQYIQRVRSFDFDMITQVIPQSDSPGNEQRDYWHSDNVNVNGSRNYMGVNDPVVDELISLLIQATSRQELVHRVRALDRVLLHGHYVVPQWFLNVDRIAYWNKLARPEVVPKNGTDLSNWWARP